MNMMVLSHKLGSPYKMQKVERPTSAANRPLKRNPKGRVGKFENMDPIEASELLKAMDRAFAKL